MLAARLKPVAPPDAAAEPGKDHKKAAKAARGGTDTLGDFLTSSTGKQIQREVIRGVFGMLKKRL
jgi:hypothetical protein